MDSLIGMERSADRGPGAPDGWPIADVTVINSDPWQCDDCWHRGAYKVYSLRGTTVREDERISDGIGDVFDRFMRRVKAAGYSGHVEFVGTGLPYRVLHTTDHY